MKNPASLTGQYLSGKLTIPILEKRRTGSAAGKSVPNSTEMLVRCSARARMSSAVNFMFR